MIFFSTSIGLEKLSRIGNGSIWHQRRSLWFSITSTHGYWIFQPWKFQVGMMYQSGIFIIMDPGYYRFTLQCYHNQSGFTAKYAYMDAVINSTDVMGTYCMWADNGSSTGIFYLEAFDTVFVKKNGEKLSHGGYRNNFMIEKIWTLIEINLK